MMSQLCLIGFDEFVAEREKGEEKNVYFWQGVAFAQSLEIERQQQRIVELNLKIFELSQRELAFKEEL